MKFKLLIAIIFFAVQGMLAQNTFRVSVKDSLTRNPLEGATAIIEAIGAGAVSDDEGVITVNNIPEGDFKVKVSHIGYHAVEFRFTFPMQANLRDLTIFLMPGVEHMEEVTLTSTRSSRTIEDIPTRIEFIAGEELVEKGNMKPGDIRMLLNESTGIRTQQTSATSYNSSIRIQGLDGRYTQLLRDGFPLYSGYAGGLSLMQIAPLDLKQVEVIKGASSTLYGGGAIAGLVNLISKKPGDEPELSFMANATSALGLDLSGFYSNRNRRTGITVFGSYNLGNPYDPADIGLTAIPQFNRFTLNPKFYWYATEHTEFLLGVNAVWEDRRGGNVNYIKGADVSDPYFENNATERISTQLGYKRSFNPHTRMEFKNSFSYFDRNIQIPDFSFEGYQRSSFSELNLTLNTQTLEWVMGMNLWTEYFNQAGETANASLDYDYQIFGIFVQNLWPINNNWSFESGFRADFHSDYGVVTLPRISILLKPSEVLTFRLGGGLGYNTPTVFTEDAERLQFRNILPIDVENSDLERSVGANFDINYRWQPFPGLTASVNTLFFYTRINNPLILTPVANGVYEFRQPDNQIDTRGAEINLKLNYGDFKLFTGYTRADVREHINGMVSEFPLVARHRLNNVLMFEREENLWIGFEAYYYSPQRLSDGSSGEAYWILGLMSEKKIGENLSLFLNFENFLDTRQTRFDTIFTGSLSDPMFRDIYAPVDGFVINGGFKINF